MRDVLEYIVSSDECRYEAMLPGFIIEQIRKQEREKQQPGIQPQLDLPDREYVPEPEPRKMPDEEGERGSVIIDYTV